MSAYVLGVEVESHKVYDADRTRTVVDSLTVDGCRWVVIDPEDREQVERLRDAIDNSGARLYGWQHIQAALCEFANPTPPKPEVYSHVVMNRAMPGEIAQSLCGKVWKPGADATVVGECPECKSLAGEWIA